MKSKVILGVICFAFILLSFNVISAITWRHSGTDMMTLDDNGNLVVESNVTADFFIGDGSLLTGISGLAPNSVNTTHIIDGEVAADDIAASAVNTTHILDSTIGADDVATGAINGTHLVENLGVRGNLTVDDKVTFSLGAVIDNIITGIITITGGLTVSGDVNTTNVGASGDVDAGGDVTAGGNVIATGDVNATNVGASGDVDVGGNVVATGNVTGTFIKGDGSELTGISGLAPNSVNSTHIIDGQVASDDIAVGAVNTTHILDSTILADDLATGSVNGTHIIDDVSLSGEVNMEDNVTFDSDAKFYIEGGELVIEY